jgi:hypothetical protein
VYAEILREGPPYNQLLSPLTPYLAMCGENSVQPLRLPLEHRTTERHLRALSYESDLAQRHLALQELSAVVSGLLQGIPGLVNQHTANGAQDSWTHLHLVLNATELSMLPFELATTPPTLPGTGPLLLNRMSPFTLTREIRGAVARECRWPDEPRILFAYAHSREPVPAEEHIAALRTALAPWLPMTPEEGVSPWLTVLADASVATIEEACREEAFTHVHILAHGASFEEGEDTRFGLVLRDRTDPERTEIVAGEALALAICTRSPVSPPPAIVTVAACQGGAPGGLLEPGSCVARALSQAGIHFVVSSQFPLTTAGSTSFTRVFYEQVILRVQDPRIALAEARQRLQVEQRDTHDWASLVAYGRLPPDLGTQLLRVRLSQSISHLYRARQVARVVLPSPTDGARFPTQPTTIPPERLRALLDRVRKARAEVEGLDAPERSFDSTRWRFVGSAWKHEADLHLQFDAEADQAVRALRSARDAYLKAHEAYLASPWAACEYLAVEGALRGSLAHERDRWAAGLFVARRIADTEPRYFQAAAELLLLEPLLTPGEACVVRLDEAKDCVDRALCNARAADEAKEPLRRQLHRWVTWWPRANLPGTALLQEHATKLLSYLDRA